MKTVPKHSRVMSRVPDSCGSWRVKHSTTTTSHSRKATPPDGVESGAEQCWMDTWSCISLPLVSIAIKRMGHGEREEAKRSLHVSGSVAPSGRARLHQWPAFPPTLATSPFACLDCISSLHPLAHSLLRLSAGKQRQTVGSTPVPNRYCKLTLHSQPTVHLIAQELHPAS